MTYEQVCSILDQTKDHDVHFFGGEPLLMGTSFYSRILERYPDHEFSMTSNLWMFMKNPEQWTPILKRINVCTSFQFGLKRRMGGLIFDLPLFLQLYKTYQKHVGYELPFISVIDEENVQHSLRTVDLARSLRTKCKLNQKRKAGKSDTAFSPHRMLEVYASIIEHGLYEYEVNSQSIVDLLSGKSGASCLYFNHLCTGDYYRMINPDGSIVNCSAVDPSVVNVYSKITDVRPSKPMIDAKCPTCPAFYLCNSCRLNVCASADLSVHCPSVLRSLKKIHDSLG